MSAEEIRQDMQRIRSNLDQDVASVVDHAKTMADYRFYLRKYPWACLGAVAALGYLAVPNRPRIFSPDVETLEKLAKKNQLLVKSKPEAYDKSGGVVSSIMTLLANAAVRTAVTFAGQNAGKLLGRKAAKNAEENQTPAQQRV